MWLKVFLLFKDRILVHQPLVLNLHQCLNPLVWVWNKEKESHSYSPNSKGRDSIVLPSSSRFFKFLSVEKIKRSTLETHLQLNIEDSDTQMNSSFRLLISPNNWINAKWLRDGYQTCVFQWWEESLIYGCSANRAISNWVSNRTTLLAMKKWHFPLDTKTENRRTTKTLK